MQKKLIALAVAGLASSAAFAQSNVTIYGTLRPSYDFVSMKDASGNKFHSITNMNSNTSTLGFKGSEDLGNGLKAIFQMEYNIDPTTEDKTKAGIGVSGTQDQFVGFSSNSWGTVKFGALNNVEKAYFGSYDPFSFTIGDYNNIFTQGVDSRNSSAAGYQSPTWNGFKFAVSYALDGQKDSQNYGSGKVDKTKTSIAADYKWGGLQLTAGYSEGNNKDGATVKAKSKSQRYGAAYTFSTKTKVFGVYGVDKDFKGRVDQSTWMIGATHPITSNITLMADYIKAADDKGTAGEQGAYNYNLGVKYALSKRTNLQALYTYMKNKADGNVASFDSGYAFEDAAGTAINGGKANAFSVRVQHSF